MKTNIGTLRKAANLSRTELAKKVGLTRQSVWFWETGQTFPRGSTLTRLARALRCTVRDLV